jgi:hypothetical protein
LDFVLLWRKERGMKLSTELKEMLETIGCDNPDKVAIVVFSSDGTAQTCYVNMELRDIAQAKHEIELDIIDKFMRVNADRYLGKEMLERE